MYALKLALRSILPSGVFQMYHRTLAILGAHLYGNPSARLIVIGVTGTKGKSSTAEMVNAILEEMGHKTALLNSIRVKIASDSKPNTMRMSMPGRMFIQALLADALKAGCTAAVLEMTSEGARQYRHRGIELDALIFTNLAPEHIESHGSYEAYADAKFSLTESLTRSRKRPRIMVANSDDAEARRYLTLQVEYVVPFSLQDHQPYAASDEGGYFQFDGMRISIKLPGEFSLKNALAAASLARAMKFPVPAIASGLGKLSMIPGRAERVEAGQDFAVVVDYAHTPDSLKALYEAYSSRKRICVLGATGGGRDMWKRPAMGKIADDMCDHVILTNEDPYDEDPRSIVDALKSGMQREPEIVMDRREAISRALSIAQETTLRQAQGDKNGCAVLITGKGTDPTIQLARGTSEAWSDARVAHEELEKLLKSRV